MLKIRWESAIIGDHRWLQTAPQPERLKDTDRKLCALERHSVRNQRRRNILQAVKEVRERWPDLRIYGNVHDGHVYCNNMSILKTDHDGKITHAPGWFEVKVLAGAVWPLPRL